MRLAERLGVSLRTLFRDYTPNEINLWLAWMKKEPSEGERIEWAVAKLCAIHTSTKEKRTTPADFIFKADWRPAIQSDVDLLRNSLSRR